MVYNPDVSSAKPATPWKPKEVEKERTQTIDEVAMIADNEGVGYAVSSYMDSSDIINPELAELWDKAGEAINALEKFLRENTTDYNY